MKNYKKKKKKKTSIQGVLAGHEPVAQHCRGLAEPHRKPVGKVPHSAGAREPIGMVRYRLPPIPANTQKKKKNRTEQKKKKKKKKMYPESIANQMRYS
jgi:hypothetical protein